MFRIIFLKIFAQFQKVYTFVKHLAHIMRNPNLNINIIIAIIIAIIIRNRSGVNMCIS